MSDQDQSACPTCGQLRVDAVLEAVEESFDALFGEAAGNPVRIELDPDLDQSPQAVSAPRPTLAELETDLLAVSQALSVLEDARCPHSSAPQHGPRRNTLSAHSGPQGRTGSNAAVARMRRSRRPAHGYHQVWSIQKT